MAVGSIQSGWGYGGITYDFNVDFVAPRIQLQDENRDVPVMSSEGEARFRAQGEALETALERGTSLSSTDNTQEIIEARAAIDALIEQVGRYGGNTASLAALRNGITTPQQAQAAVFEAIQVSATLLQNATTDRDTARIVASNLNRVLEQTYVQNAAVWFERHTSDEFLSGHLIYNAETNPSGIYERASDGQYRIREDLIFVPGDETSVNQLRIYERRDDGTIVNRITGQEIGATYEDQIAIIRRAAEPGQTALGVTDGTVDIGTIRDSQLDVAERFASVGVLVPVELDPRTRSLAAEIRRDHLLWTGREATNDEIIRYLDDSRGSLNPDFISSRIAVLQAENRFDRLQQQQVLIQFDGRNDAQDVSNLAGLLDRDHNGFINDQEFARFADNNNLVQIAEAMRNAGVLRDANGDGDLNAADVLGTLQLVAASQAQGRGAEAGVAR